MSATHGPHAPLDQQAWLELAVAETPERLNPCVRVFGAGPEGATCKSCEHLLRWDYHNKRYLKCGLRRNTHGAATDHKANWAACARYVREVEE